MLITKYTQFWLCFMGISRFSKKEKRHTNYLSLSNYYPTFRNAPTAFMWYISHILNRLKEYIHWGRFTKISIYFDTKENYLSCDYAQYIVMLRMPNVLLRSKHYSWISGVIWSIKIWITTITSYSCASYQLLLRTCHILRKESCFF